MYKYTTQNCKLVITLAEMQNLSSTPADSGVDLVSRVKPSNCFRLHPMSMISKHQTWFLAACRRLEKLVLPFIFTRLSILDDVKLQSYPTTVLIERI